VLVHFRLIARQDRDSAQLPIFLLLPTLSHSFFPKVCLFVSLLHQLSLFPHFLFHFSDNVQVRSNWGLLNEHTTFPQREPALLAPH
jgi:hypothetical protein